MTKIQISLHDGSTINAELSAYNAAELANKMNDPKLLMIVVGDAIINKNIVRLVTPVTTQA
ncbi:hypothetical protein [Bacillus seohaeanensis]|jgi:hypothetical protein|uniref:TGS domain-containing protein n=1 Tax=Bacillus seohaeanensis TaxID=284580 RepID=A0ABW5RT20_9BACI